MGVEEPCGPFSISLFRLDETSEAGAPRTDTGRVICAKAAPGAAYIYAEPVTQTQPGDLFIYLFILVLNDIPCRGRASTGRFGDALLFFNSRRITK